MGLDWVKNIKEIDKEYYLTAIPAGVIYGLLFLLIGESIFYFTRINELFFIVGLFAGQSVYAFLEKYYRKLRTGFYDKEM